MTVKGQHILVTGGAGFLGSHVVEELVRRGALVTVVDRLKPERSDHLTAVSDAIRILSIDLRHSDFAAHLKTEQYFAVVHLAGPASVPASVEDPYRDFEEGLHTTMGLLEILRKDCRDTRLILASSAAVYGNPVNLPMSETDPTHPISPYGVAKLAVERYAAVYSQLYGLSTASLRFFSIYGPRQRKMIVYELISKAALNPDTLPLRGTGTETRDFIYVTDAVQAILSILESGAMAGEVYNIATGQPHTTLEVAQTITAALGMSPEITFTGQGRAGDPDRWCADITKTIELGFTPQFTLDEGIRETVRWYRQIAEIT